MEVPESLAEPGAPGEVENAVVAEKPHHLKSQDLTFFVELRRRMTVFSKLYKSAEVAAKRCAKK